MSQPTLDELLTVPSQEDILNQEVLPELVKRKVRVTDWIVGGVYRAMAYVVALLRVNVRSAIATLTAAGFEDYAFGFSSPPPAPDGSTIDVTGWAPIIAKQRYGIERLEATYTRRTITLANASATSYGPLQPGKIVIAFPSGNRYVLDEVVTIAPSGETQATFRSQYATDSAAGLVYNDAAGSAISFVTANYPGVTATNPETDYGVVSQSGSGIGTLVLSGTPVHGHNVAVKITASGNAGTSTVGWSTSVDGATFTARSGVSVTNLGGLGINIALTDNGGNPAFIFGSVYYFQTGASDITEVGADVETPPALGARCRAVLPSMAFAKDGAGNWIPTSPTRPAYEALALSANTQVKTVLASVDSTINNQVNLIVAGQGGAVLTSVVIANVQAFFDHYQMLTDSVAVASPTQRVITLAGMTITVPSAQLAAAKAALLRSLQLYLGGVDPVVPLGINGVVDHAYIVSLARRVGTLGGTEETFTINGATDDLELPVTPGAFEVAYWTQSIDAAFTWATR